MRACLQGRSGCRNWGCDEGGGLKECLPSLPGKQPFLALFAVTMPGKACRKRRKTASSSDNPVSYTPICGTSTRGHLGNSAPPPPKKRTGNEFSGPLGHSWGPTSSTWSRQRVKLDYVFDSLSTLFRGARSRTFFLPLVPKRPNDPVAGPKGSKISCWAE